MAASGDDPPPPSLQPHNRAFIATTSQSPRSGAPVLSVSRFQPLAPFPLASPARFSRSIQEPGRASRCLHAGCSLVRIRTSPELMSQEGSLHDFDIAQSAFDASKAVRLRSSLAIVPAGIIVPTFPRRSRPRLLTTPARGGLRSATPSPNPEGLPPSTVQLRSAVWTGDARDTRPRMTIPVFLWLRRLGVRVQRI